MLALQEKRNKQKGMITSIIIHLLLLLFFLLYKAWPFDPPLAPEYGIEVNFGTTNVGSGDTQNTSETGENTEESEGISETENVNEETATIEVTEETEQETSSSSEEVVEAVESETESLVEATTETNPVTNNTTSETQSTETVEESNVMGGPSSNNNNGDDENEIGDKGQEDGKINESDIFKGTNGGGNGSSYDLAGWKWDSKPSPKDKSNENGKIIFEIKVDDEGEMESVRIVESTVSTPTANIYLNEVRKLTFSRTSGGNVPPHSTGTVTFIITSN